MLEAGMVPEKVFVIFDLSATLMLQPKLASMVLMTFERGAQLNVR